MLEGKCRKANKGRGSREDYFRGLAASVDNTFPPGPNPRSAPASRAPCRPRPGEQGTAQARVGRGARVPAGVAHCACSSRPARPLEERKPRGPSACRGSQAPPPHPGGLAVSCRRRKAGVEPGAEGGDPARGPRAGRRRHSAQGW